MQWRGCSNKNAQSHALLHTKFGRSKSNDHILGDKEIDDWGNDIIFTLDMM